MTVSEQVETLLEERDSLEDLADRLQDECDEWQRLTNILFRALHDCNNTVANQFWHDEPFLQEIYRPEHFTESPGLCLGETSRVDNKSWCQMWERWTNCWEMGHCTKTALKEVTE